MKLAIIAIIAVLVLGGGAAGAYFYFNNAAQAAAGPADEVAKAAHDAKSKKAGEEAVSTTQFVQLDPLILPVMDDEGVTQTVSLVVSLEVPDEASAAEVKRLSPRLKDAFIQDMYGTLNRKNSMNKGVLQVGLLKKRLNTISMKVLGEGKFNEVLLQVVQQRSL